MTDLPPPGLQGDYRDSCVACYRGTDSIVGIEGEAEFITAVMTKMGMSIEEAANTLSNATGCDPGMVPVGRVQVGVRLCHDCARKTDFETGTLGGSIPYYSQGFDIDDGQHR